MKIAVLAGAAVAALWPAAAGANELTVQNLTSTDIVAIASDPGEIENFKRVGAGVSQSFEISMPEGQCEVELSFRFDDATTTVGTWDVCEAGPVRITEEY